MKKNINKSLITICIISVLLSAIGVTFVYYGQYQKQVKDDLKISLELLKATGLFDDPEYDITFADLKTDGDVLRITWIDAAGNVLYDNDLDESKLENHLNREEIQEALTSGSGESVRQSDTMNLNTFYYAARLSNNTVLRVSAEARSIIYVFSSAAPLILMIVLFIIMFCVTLSQIITRQLLTPIDEMIDNIDDPDNQPAYTELQPFSEKIRKQYDEILEAAQVREQFSANVSHELKTPLTSIRGYGELIENDKSVNSKVQHFAHEIVNNASRLHNLINDTIFLSRLDQQENPNKETIDLYELAQSCTRNLQLNASQKNVTLSCQGVSAKTDADREMIMILLQNLIQNAITYNKDNGNVWVTVSSDKDKAILSVKDNGIGIPQKDQKRVFERFYRVDKSRSKQTGGTSLGLAIVKHIAEIHNAEIVLESQEDKGTTVTVIFAQPC